MSNTEAKHDRPAVGGPVERLLGAGSEARCGCIACMKERGDGQTYGRIFWPQHMLQMTLCPTCGNKRCPHANDHRHACTGSNEPGQAGSAYA
jgi:hypothetical protein